MVARNPTSPKVIAQTHSFAIDPLFRKAAEGFDGHIVDSVPAGVNIGLLLLPAGDKKQEEGKYYGNAFYENVVI